MSATKFTCILCQSGTGEPFLVSNKVKGDSSMLLSVVCCSTCGHVQLCPPVYDMEFYQADGQVKNVIEIYGTPFEKLIEHSWTEARRRVERFSRNGVRTKNSNPNVPFRALDVGGGYGFFGSELASALTGAEVTVLEPSLDRANRGMQYLQANAEKITPKFLTRCLDEEFCSEYEGTFDLVTMWHVLEHVIDPEDLLKNAFRLLTSEGTLCIEVPNLNDELMGSSTAFRERSFMIEHISYFSPHTLRLVALRAAPEAVTRVFGYQRYGIQNYMHWVFHNKPQGANPDLFEGVDRIWVESVWRQVRETAITSDAIFMTMQN